MDMNMLLASACGAALISLMASIPARLGILITHLFFRVITATYTSQISTLDTLFRVTGFCSTRLPDGRPGEGLHFTFRRGFILAWRTQTAEGERSPSTVSYTVWTCGNSAHEYLITLLAGDPSEIMIRYVYNPMPWRTSVVTTRERRVLAPRTWQKKILARIIDLYTKKDSALILVHGKPGDGKSTLGTLVAIALKTLHTCEPVVVRNCDLTVRGLTVDDYLGSTPTKHQPIVLMFDEFDGAVKKAEKGNKGESGEHREGSSHADTKATLTSIQDRLALMPHVIVIATTNDVELVTKKEYQAYTREGRFDFTTKSD